MLFPAPPRPITPACGLLFAPYYEAFASKRPWSRYYMSLMVLGQFPHNYGYLILGDCLVIVKRRLLGANKIVYTIVPPMSRTGDLKAELDTTKDLLALGVSVRVNAEDIPLLGVEDVPRTPDTTRTEFIYGAGVMRDGADKHLRYATRQCHQAVTAGLVRVRTLTGIDSSTLSACLEVSEEWKKARGLKPMGADFPLTSFNTFATARPEKYALTLIEELHNGQQIPVAFSVTERITPNWGVIVSRKTRFGWRGHIKQLAKATQGYDGTYWATVAGENSQWNGGPGSMKELADAKRHRKPIYETTLLTLRPTVKQHPDLWEATKISPIPQAPNVLELF